MQITAEILTSSMVNVFFGARTYERASDYEKAVSQHAVMSAYQDACERQQKADEAERLDAARKTDQAEYDYLTDIERLLRTEKIDHDRINILIACLPCERAVNRNGDPFKYTTDSNVGLKFMERLLEKRFFNHAFSTFSSMRENPYVTTSDAVLVLIVTIGQRRLNLHEKLSSL